MTAKLFVGNLSWNATEEELQSLFAQIGEVLSARIITDPYTGRSKGFGFVEMANEEVCNLAIEKLDNVELDSRPIRVSLARQENKERSSRPPRRNNDRGSDRYNDRRSRAPSWKDDQ